MKKYIIDTNEIISFVTDRNLVQQEAVAPLFEAAYPLIKVPLSKRLSVLYLFANAGLTGSPGLGGELASVSFS